MPEKGSRLWFNCNPAGPRHWLYTEWILESEKKNCLHLHFTMEDNPGLSEQVRQRYRSLYTVHFTSATFWGCGFRRKAGSMISLPQKW